MSYDYFLKLKLGIINIPYKQLEMNQDMPAALQEDFFEIERLLKELQYGLNVISDGGIPPTDIIGGVDNRPFFGLNKHLMLDFFGISPDFIKRYQNQVKNSGFEWYDPVTMKPRDWEGDGVVDITEAWEGKASLKLTAGQTMQMETGVDPVLWGEKQTRVAFRHKGGAVRVKVLSEDSAPPDEWGPLTLYTPNASSDSANSFAQCKNGKVIYLWGTATKLVQGYADNAITLTTSNFTVSDTVDIFDGADYPRGSVFNDLDGDLYLAVTWMSNAWSGGNAQNLIYKSVSGNGVDSLGAADWALHGTVQSLSTVADYTRTDAIHFPIGKPYIMESGRWVLPCPFYVRDVYLYARAGIYTSDDGGANWTKRVGTTGGLLAYGVNAGRVLGWWDDKLWWGYGTGGAVGDMKIRSSPDGEDWSHEFSLSGMGGASGTIYGYNFFGLGDYLYLMFTDGNSFYGSTGTVNIYRSSTPEVLASWEQVYREYSSSFGDYPVYSYANLFNGTLAMNFGQKIISISIDRTAAYLYDNSVDEGVSDPIINQEGEQLDYPAQSEWVYPTPPALSAIRTPAHDITQGYKSFYFIPVTGLGPVVLVFENIDVADPCYIDAVNLEPDFMGKWPSDYRPGLDSTPPEPHADTHAEGGADEITPASIGAASANHGNEAHNEAYLHEAVKSLNALINNVTIAGTGGITVNKSGQTLNIDGSAIAPVVVRYEPLTNGSLTVPEILFGNGDILMGEVS